MDRRCICHEHRPECDCEDNPERAFVVRGAQIVAIVLLGGVGGGAFVALALLALRIWINQQ
jgi:uncharacterized membrane protein